eukprot:CAMPEP_0178418380 /NCGR_PEP_ID=MMETSP0689_2-20121128/25058_1 /TAXON_ID=160604 /ORGANISM="Amphidinium massartii, Strain CS-259" /LENGTH=76 /DNA_ID=CAMNT_0020039771 /DNA_START=100 /DNA_END=327 /DNA_ORIENTATION=-
MTALPTAARHCSSSTKSAVAFVSPAMALKWRGLHDCGLTPAESILAKLTMPEKPGRWTPSLSARSRRAFLSPAANF